MEINRNALIYYVIKYEANWHKVANAIANKEVYKIIYVKKCLTIFDDLYPKCFLDLDYPPWVIFYKGNIDLLNKECVSIVGSRVVCEYGKNSTIAISDYLAEKYCLVSGMAKGVDSIVHSYGLLKNSSIGVLGCGIDTIYPKCNTDLFTLMSKKGLLLSEYYNDVSPKAYHFPWRNRLIAALGKYTVVTQASIKSGTMITVNHTIALNKDVFVVPYAIDNLEGYGCNYLIQQGASCIYDLNLLP